MISGINNKQSHKCDVCIESKLTKKSCYSVQHETELLWLIHPNLGDLKHTTTRGRKKILWNIYI